jgi:hypothetical protein
VKLTTHQLVQSLRERGSIHPLPNTSSWRSYAQGQHYRLATIKMEAMWKSRLHSDKHRRLVRRLRHYATSRKVAGSIPVEVIGFIKLPNPSSRTMILGSTQPLAEMSTRNLPDGKGRPARKADLTAICELIF